MDELSSGVSERLAHVRSRVADATAAAGRGAESVRLLAVSKTHPTDLLHEAMAAGVREFGESRVQELTAKAREFAEGEGSSHPGSESVRWVMIGPVQTNKARDVAAFAHEVQTIERGEVAAALDRRLEQADRSLAVCLQVNTSGEASKSGVAPADLVELARQVATLERVQITGLMTIATRGGDEREARRCFRLLATLREQVRAEAISGVVMDELSMGMSGDLEWAIDEGSTTVRVGTAIFGNR